MPEPSDLPPDFDPAEHRREADAELTAVDVNRGLDELDALVSSARSMPMSGACVINRGELRHLVGEVRTALPVELRHARWLLERRAEIVADGTRQAEQLVETGSQEQARLVQAGSQEQARLVQAGSQEQARLVGESEVLATATQAAADLTAEAEQDAARMRAETDDYAERKLAALEETLHQALAAVRHGRQTLAERSPDRRPAQRSARAH